jgi:mannose-1-phosphate guanylyltransferase/mannose-6-phosphate isomerase
MIPVILSGGSGTRLWPVSRKKLPKQLCDFLGSTLLAQTLERLKILGAPWILTTAPLAPASAMELRNQDLNAENLILEPFGRNTAAAIALLCRRFQLDGLEKEIVGVFAADHMILDVPAFRTSVATAEKNAAAGNIVTLGLQPTYPATGYGYIEIKPKTLSEGAFAVKGFREKPGLEMAEQFLASGHFLWNSGIFIFKVSRMIEHLNRLMPELWRVFEKLDLQTVSSPEKLQAIYESIESVSIDYGVMEKLTEQVCVPCKMGWSDLGSWDDIAMLIESGQLRSRENSAVVVTEKSSGCFVFSDNEKRVGLIGVSDLIVIDTRDALLISRRGATQDVKAVVGILEKQGDRSVIESRAEERPWGYFEVLKDEPHFKSKKITVKPGQQISYQSHAKRSEHWIIVKGVGEVTLNEEKIPVLQGSTVFIEQGSKHRIRNTSSEPLEFIEVQTGSYFGEDDIVRYSDDYRRI